jgi:hypothetical protein
MGRDGGEGRVPSLIAAAVEREVPPFFYSLMCRPSGIRLKLERNEVLHRPQGNMVFGIFFGRKDKGACRFGFTHDH